MSPNIIIENWSIIIIYIPYKGLLKDQWRIIDYHSSIDSSAILHKNIVIFIYFLKLVYTLIEKILKCHFNRIHFKICVSSTFLDQYLRQDLTQRFDDITDQLSNIEDKLNLFITFSCGGMEGWRKVVIKIFSDPTVDCPSGWMLNTDTIRSCGKSTHNSDDICDQTV